jgi:uncharacterized membrane protein
MSSRNPESDTNVTTETMSTMINMLRMSVIAANVQVQIISQYLCNNSSDTLDIDTMRTVLAEYQRTLTLLRSDLSYLTDKPEDQLNPLHT